MEEDAYLKIRGVAVTLCLCALTTLDTSVLVERAVERETGSVGVVQ